MRAMVRIREEKKVVVIVQPVEPSQIHYPVTKVELVFVPGTLMRYTYLYISYREIICFSYLRKVKARVRIYMPKVV
jgi:hypothetical protein